MPEAEFATDREYEDQRAAAEIRFSASHDDWLLQAIRNASDALSSLVDRCFDFIRDDLQAYTEMLIRQNVCGQRGVDQLENHKLSILAEAHRRKWLPGISELAESGVDTGSGEKDWATVTEYADHFFGQRYAPQLWSGALEPVRPSQQQHPEESLAEPATGQVMPAEDGPDESTDPIAAERRRLLDNFKARTKALGIKATDEDIAKAAKPGRWHDRTVVTRWKRNHPKSKPPEDRLIRNLLAKNPADIWPKAK